MTHRHAMTEFLPRPVRVNLADRVAAILRRYVILDNLPTGTQLPPERHLADTMNVSRTVLREALSRLIGEGLLARQSPRVLVVGEFDRSAVIAGMGPIDAQEMEFHDLMELRIIIEIGSIDVIVERATEKHLGAIEKWVMEGERRMRSGEPIHLADIQFHASLLQALDNSAVDSMLPLIEEQIRSSLLYDPHQLAEMHDVQRVMREHRQIFEAISARDAETARRIMSTHLQPYIERRTQSRLAKPSHDR